MTLTAIGFVALIVAAVTATFDRLQVTIGGPVLRNSSVMRPVVIAGVTWVIGAPAHVLRGAAVGAFVLLVLPVAAYRANVARSQQTHQPIHNLRECLSPIVKADVARGGSAPGFWVEARTISFIPFHYLRGLGPWNQRGWASDETVVKNLLGPDALRPVLLSTDRYREVMSRLVVDRTFVLERAARIAAVDPGVLEMKLREAIVGLLTLPTETFVLPGPYAVCGFEQVRLVPR